MEELSASPLVHSLIYDGDSHGWGVHVTAPTPKLDAYLTRLLSFLVKTPMMATTADGVQPADREAVERLGGRVRYELKIVNSFVVDLPLERVGDLADYPRIIALRYDTPLVPA